MSSRVRSGKSLRIASSVIPPARYSSTSYTVMRVPLIQGFPERTAGFTEIRSCQTMARLYSSCGSRVERAVRSASVPAASWTRSPASNESGARYDRAAAGGGQSGPFGGAGDEHAYLLLHRATAYGGSASDAFDVV